MAHHDQRTSPPLMVCPECKRDSCETCVDRLRMFYTDMTICTCTRTDHELKRDGEPVVRQVKDPFNGYIHAPGLTVSPDGEVEFRDGGH